MLCLTAPHKVSNGSTTPMTMTTLMPLLVVPVCKALLALPLVWLLHHLPFLAMLVPCLVWQLVVLTTFTSQCHSRMAPTPLCLPSSNSMDMIVSAREMEGTLTWFSLISTTRTSQFKVSTCTPSVSAQRSTSHPALATCPVLITPPFNSLYPRTLSILAPGLARSRCLLLTTTC